MQTVADRPEVALSPIAPSRTAELIDRVRRRWAGMAGRIGMGLSVLGFLLILVAWNGAAGLDYVSGQVPYIISGAAGGIGLIILGAALVVAESNRRDRSVLQSRIEELSAALARLSAATSAVAGNGTSVAAAPRRRAAAATPTADLVVAGRTSFHDPSCHLVEGRTDGVKMSKDDALAEGLSPCRVCNP